MRVTTQEQTAIDWWMNLLPSKRQELKEYYFMKSNVGQISNSQILEIYRQETYCEEIEL